MELKQLSKRTRTFWYIRNVLWLLPQTVAAAVALAVTADLPAFAAVAAVVAALYAVSAVLLLVFPALSYRYYRYGYDDKRIVIRYGVIFRHRITVPLCQVQDLHVYQGPIMTAFGIAKVILATGGSNFDIAGLDKAVAEQLVEEVEQRLRERIEGLRHEEV